MAFKIDFSKLDMSPDAVADREAEREARLRAEDEQRRDTLSKTTVRLTLEEDSDVRHTMGGSTAIHLRGLNEEGRPTRAIFYPPDHLSDNARSILIESLRKDASLEAAGYWRKREWKDQSGAPRSAWEFQAQRLKAVEGTGVAAERKGVLAQAAEVSDRAKDARPNELSKGPHSSDLAQAHRAQRNAGRDGR